MSGYSIGKRRKRVYKRAFDWEEARRLRAEGWTIRAIAKHLGVTDNPVQKVCAMKELPPAVKDAREVTFDRSRYVSCPACGGPMLRKSELCRHCTSARRLQPVKVQRLPGSKRVMLGSVTLGRIVKCQGRWGVVESMHRHTTRRVHYWDGPPESVPVTELVDVGPSWRVFVDDEEQIAEVIA